MSKRMVFRGIALIVVIVGTVSLMTAGTSDAQTQGNVNHKHEAQTVTFVSPEKYKALAQSHRFNLSPSSIFCTLDPQDPFIIGSSGNEVEANGTAECSATRAIWNDTTAIWGYNGSKYQETGGSVSSNPPTAPDGQGGVIKTTLTLAGSAKKVGHIITKSA
jgi:hypothetical protein